jgi:hypothetical protein
MYQYMQMEPEYIVTPNGGTKRVIGFRKRTAYEAFGNSKVMQAELLRVDLLGDRLLNDAIILTALIDANEKDIFSFSENEAINIGIA